MPPSPAIRISPGRELKAENHKRGCSLESGILFREKDDDLALFNEVQSKERESFLLQTDDDFDDMFSTKLRHFPDYKLGISIPAQGERSDLLSAEGDKNDYDWLITPPETPLFPSLDDEAPQVSFAPRGRPRSQPITISRSSTMEKGYRSGRGSASPHRLSPSPRSGSSALQSRSRPSSATHPSPPSTLRHSSPSKRLSPPPSKSIPAPRTSTPTLRRMSTGSAGATVPSKVRGASPIKTSRGNSTSPKIKAWQSNIPGFSLEAPPNLRTSLADRPASYVRGSSPASRNGSRSRRQSMSPTASRSVSSSRSHERDQFSSYSRCSVASSGDDEVDSLLSVPVSSSDPSVPRSIGTSPNNRTMGFSKKPTKTFSNSAPKRPFDSALRQMDKKGPPQNMFRPLLSSVPSSTFYAGKVSGHRCALMSRNSSITTSSNASSDQGTSGAVDAVENEQNQDDVTSDFVKGQSPTMHDEIFVMDHADAIDEAIENRISEGHQDEENDDLTRVISRLAAAESSSLLDTTPDMVSSDVFLDGKHYYSDADETPEMGVCSGCNDGFPSSELVREGDLWFCLECKSMKMNSIATLPVKTVKKDKEIAGDVLDDVEFGLPEVPGQSVSVPESVPVTSADELEMHHLDSITNDDQHSHSDPSRDHEVSQSEKRGLTVADQHVIVRTADCQVGRELLRQSGVCSTSEDDVSEVTGISLLLKTSSSRKGHLVQSRSFTACNIRYDDFFYGRDSVNSLRSSGGYSNASISSSVDLGSSRQREAHIRRQSSGKKSDHENHRYEILMMHKRSLSSLSVASVHGPQFPSTTLSCVGDSSDIVSSNNDREVSGIACADPLEQSVASEMKADCGCTVLESSTIFMTDVELLCDLTNAHSEGTPIDLILDFEEPVLHESENLTNKSRSSINEETTAQLQTSTQGEDAVQSSCADGEDVTGVPHLSSVNDMSEREIQNADNVYCDSQSDIDSMNSMTCTDELLESSVSVEQSGVETMIEESDISVPVNCVIEESTVLLENLSGIRLRSLTLEEATDTILFCSSIVHNLAYEAANMAIDKEKSSVEVLRPTMTLVDRRDLHSRPLGKRSSKSQKARQRRLETYTKPHPIVAETEEKHSPHIVRSPSKGDNMHPLKLESKCNCSIM